MDKLFDRVMMWVFVPLTMALAASLVLFMVGGPVYFVVATSRQPYAQGDAVVIKANGLPAVVQSKDPSFVRMSYVDDFGHMSEAELLYSQVEATKGEGK